MNLYKKSTDVRIVDATLYFIALETRVPFKFGAETVGENHA